MKKESKIKLYKFAVVIWFVVFIRWSVEAIINISGGANLWLIVFDIFMSVASLVVGVLYWYEIRKNK
ncbi:MAG: hypothetical protein E7521_03230 [Ruminococcaceae bacterium]|nr:hypothetical protein [Oscillospiraceae bacterium]